MAMTALINKLTSRSLCVFWNVPGRSRTSICRTAGYGCGCDWSVVSLNARRVSLILDITAKVRVEVQFEDYDSAIYDREDDRWLGVENASTEVEDEVDVEVFGRGQPDLGRGRRCRSAYERDRRIWAL